MAAVCLPFLIAQPEGFRQGLEYAGVPGRGGLSVVFDPVFAIDRRDDAYLALLGEPNSLAQFLSSASGAITVLVLVALGAFLLRYRPATIDAVVLLWLALFVFNPNFLPQYLIWALPFFLMAGYLAETAALQLAVVPYLLLNYLSPGLLRQAGSRGLRGARDPALGLLGARPLRRRKAGRPRRRITRRRTGPAAGHGGGDRPLMAAPFEALRPTIVPPMDSGATPLWRRYLPDLLIGAVLLVAALLLRIDGMPTDGLWLDDAIPAAGIDASWSQLFIVGNEHPGFIALLKLWDSITGGSPDTLAIIPLTAGIAAPVLLYAALRWLGSARSISALLAAGLAVAGPHIVYSGRVKSYTLDLLVVLVAFVVVPRLATMTWRWSTALAWVVLSLLVGTLSGFALIALGVAGIILVAHPASDLRIRLAAVAAQGIGSFALLIAETGTYATSNLEIQWRQEWDAFVDFSFAPEFLQDSFVHLRRIGEAFVNGPAWIAAVCIVVALIALAIAAWNGRVGARYLLLVLIAAFLASILGKLPFGRNGGSVISNGQRVSLWLIPVIAVGVAYALIYIRRRTVRALQRALDLMLFAGAGAILVVSLNASQEPYPWSAPGIAVTELIEEAGPDDAIVLPWPSQTPPASNPTSATESGQLRRRHLDSSPTFADPRLYPTGVVFSDEPIRVSPTLNAFRCITPIRSTASRAAGGRPWIRASGSSDSSRIALRHSGRSRSNPGARVGTHGAISLTRTSRVAGVWFRRGRVDLVRMLGHCTVGVTRTAVVAVSPEDAEARPIIVLEIVRWPTREAAETAEAALGRPQAKKCVSLTFQENGGGLNPVAEVTSRLVGETTTRECRGTDLRAHPEKRDGG